MTPETRWPRIPVAQIPLRTGCGRLVRPEHLLLKCLWVACFGRQARQREKRRGRCGSNWRRRMASTEPADNLAPQHPQPARVYQRNHSARISCPGASMPGRERHGHDLVRDRNRLAIQNRTFAGWNPPLQSSPTRSEQQSGSSGLFQRRYLCRSMGVEMKNTKPMAGNGPFMGGSGADPWS